MASYTPVKLPYYAPAHQLPEALPSLQEIKASNKIYPCHWSDRTIARVGEHFLVKFGDNVDLAEAQNMILVATSSSMAVPKVYAAYEAVQDVLGIYESKTNVIVMEFIPGVRLSTVYERFDEQQSLSMIALLRQQFDALRSIPSPGFYGALGRKPLQSLFWTRLVRHRGPFPNHVDFVISVMHTFLRRPIDVDRYVGRIRRQRQRSSASVFTHCDIQPRNIIIRDSDGLPVVVDWEFAAWLPPYWELVVMTNMLEARVESSWVPWMEQLFPEFKAIRGIFDEALRKHAEW
ncbi:kinase-like domain-containing protein [Xylariaceae sp. FL0016]|nr:kinase-like domain-containing protein [Xylariaceae sp. FL0016]